MTSEENMNNKNDNTKTKQEYCQIDSTKQNKNSVSQGVKFQPHITPNYTFLFIFMFLFLTYVGEGCIFPKHWFIFTFNPMYNMIEEFSLSQIKTSE